MALPPLELPPIEERVALLPGGPFALWKRWDEIRWDRYVPRIGEGVYAKSAKLARSFAKLVVGRVWDFAYRGNAAKMVEEQADVAQLVEQLIRNQ